MYVYIYIPMGITLKHQKIRKTIKKFLHWMDEYWANRRWLLAEMYPYAAYSLPINKHNKRKGKEMKQKTHNK